MLIKNMKMLLYDENKKCIDSEQINQNKNYSELQHIDFSKHQCQVDDVIINAIENVNTFKNNLFKKPNAQNKQQQQQESSSDVQEVQTTTIQQPQQKQKKNAGQLQQDQRQPNAQDNDSIEDRYSVMQFNVKDIGQSLSKIFYSKQTCKIPDNTSDLNQLKLHIISKLKLSNNVLEASIQLITSEIIIWALNTITSKQNIHKGELKRKKFSMKYNSLNEQAATGQTTQSCKDSFILYFSNKISHSKNDLVVILKNDYLFFFTIQNHERKDEVEFYLEPLSNCDRLCNVNFMSLSEKQQFFNNKKSKDSKNNHQNLSSITQEVEYFIFYEFQNTYIQLKAILDDYLFSKNGCDRVIFDHCQRILDKKHPINTKFQTVDDLDDYKGSIKSLFKGRQNIATQSIMLNSHQISALQRIKNQIYVDFEKSRVQLLRGIFGSGKSELLRELIESLYLGANNQQFNILVLSVTNIAVDNILHRLLNSGIVDKDRMQRLGTGCQIEDLQPIVSSNYRASCFVTGITCASCQKLLNETPSEFSLLIIDEASQMKLSDLIFLGLHVQVTHILLCGDPAQLPPIAEQVFNQKSVLQLFIEQGYDLSNLFLQYRCVQPIAELCSQLFYQGQVESFRSNICETVYGNVLQCLHQELNQNGNQNDFLEISSSSSVAPQGQRLAFPQSQEATEAAEATEVLTDEIDGTNGENEENKENTENQQKNNVNLNKEPGTIVSSGVQSEPKKRRARVRIIKKLESLGEKPLPNLIPIVSTIQVYGAFDTVYHGSRLNVLEANTIISFITFIVDTHQILPSQIGVICPYRQQSAYLKSKLPDVITVSTVDSFQGSERDIIIVSLTKAENVNDYGTNVFLNHGCRVNVAISRARNHIVIFKSTQNNVHRPISVNYSLRANHGFWDIILTYCQNINTMFSSFESFKEYQQSKYNEYKTIYEEQGEEKLKEVIYFDFSPVCFKLQRNKEIDGLKSSDKDQVNYMNYNTVKREDDPTELMEIARQYMNMVERYRISDQMDHPGEPRNPVYEYIDKPNADHENADGFEILATLGYQW